ncbi:galactosylceramidase [Kitasatospora sp. NBC_00315]|uniref:galactosylceramidase n=1 Tax=Kitasatospora sp. NBC_00315 TaxID=2975963 RepID=UPI0032473B9E
MNRSAADRRPTTRPHALVLALLLALGGTLGPVASSGPARATAGPGEGRGERPVSPEAAGAAAAPVTEVVLDGASAGRTYDGIGAASGGGGNSRLLYDYPEPQRSEILDYLFKPGYGASLQILKVEVGGDTNSTDGAEPSAEHTPDDTGYDRGYEWWLMEQARARNPAIGLYALAWGAPGWIGGGRFWSSDMIDYYLRWIRHARDDHGLTIDYLGGWNERGFDRAWYRELHAALAAEGLPTRVVGADDGWDVADAMAEDPAFADAVDVIGAHYPCGWLSDQTSCPSTPAAVAGGKPLWASENGSHDLQDGASLVRATNRDYIDGRMTAYINWPVVAAAYQGLPYDTVGLLLANQPWSGAYTVGRALWATAHTTRFTRPGWRYLDSACGYLGGDRTAGSYVTLRSPDSAHWTTVVETTTASTARTLSVRPRGGLSTTAVQVWASDLNAPDAGRWMIRQADPAPGGGAFSLTLRPGYAYTLTNESAEARGTAVGPAGHGLALPYADDFEDYAPGREARYLADMQGSFETAPCTAGRGGICVRQATPRTPILWQQDSTPFALLGDGDWTDYTVRVDAMLPQAGAVELLGRAGPQGRPQGNQAGYRLRIADTGAWSILRTTDQGVVSTLAAGRAAAPGTSGWHRIGLTLRGPQITATLDDAVIGGATDTAYGSGRAGLGTDGYHPAQFDNLSVAGA